MARSQAEWFEILRSWAPSPQFGREDYSVPAWQGIAAVFAAIELVLENHYKETFIFQADGAYLDEHGLERNLTRNPGELDPAFAVRIANLLNTTNIPALKQAIEAILKYGCVRITDNEVIQPFYNRENFYDRGELYMTYFKNFFTILINPQVEPSREYFFDREYFHNREAFFSAFPRTELNYIYEAIVQLVEKNKALGTMYQVVVTEVDLCA